jgi:ATP-dependent Lon protease
MDNEKDLPEIPVNVKKGLEIVPVRTIDEVLTHALVVQCPEIAKWLNPKKKLDLASAKDARGLIKGGDVIRH